MTLRLPLFTNERATCSEESRVVVFLLISGFYVMDFSLTGTFGFLGLQCLFLSWFRFAATMLYALMSDKSDECDKLTHNILYYRADMTYHI